MRLEKCLIYCPRKYLNSINYLIIYFNNYQFLEIKSHQTMNLRKEIQKKCLQKKKRKRIINAIRRKRRKFLRQLAEDNIVSFTLNKVKSKKKLNVKKSLFSTEVKLTNFLYLRGHQLKVNWC